MYIDVHCHLDFLEKEGFDLKKTVERARNNGVSAILSNGVNSKSNKRVLELASEYKEIKPCLGIYPIDALSMSDVEINKEIQFIMDNQDKIAGIGEVGMDFSGDKDHKRQEEIFKKFIKLATDLDLPIEVHSRKAEEKCIEILEKAGAGKVVMHYFSGKIKLVDRVLKNDWCLSIPTAVKNSQHFQKVVEKTKIENLLCETDSPYSHPDKEFPNEPANVIESYRMIAKIKKLKLKDVEKRLEKNFKRIFG